MDHRGKASPGPMGAAVCSAGAPSPLSCWAVFITHHRGVSFPLEPRRSGTHVAGMPRPWRSFHRHVCCAVGDNGPVWHWSPIAFPVFLCLEPTKPEFHKWENQGGGVGPGGQSSWWRSWVQEPEGFSEEGVGSHQQWEKDVGTPPIPHERSPAESHLLPCCCGGRRPPLRAPPRPWILLLVPSRDRDLS